MDIKDIKPFDNKIEIIELPATRIIGKAVRNGGKLGNTAPKLWDEVYRTGIINVLKDLPNIGHKELFGWTMEYDPKTRTFLYFVCALTPANTTVPEGYDFRDIPECKCAVGKYGDSVYATLDQLKNEGYESNWGNLGLGWNAELYFDEEEAKPPKRTASPWHWLIPIR